MDSAQDSDLVNVLEDGKLSEIKPPLPIVSKILLTDFITSNLFMTNNSYKNQQKVIHKVQLQIACIFCCSKLKKKQRKNRTSTSVVTIFFQHKVVFKNMLGHFPPHGQ